MTDQSASEIDRGVSEIICSECLTAPRLKSLNKNHGTTTGCDCDDLAKSMDAVPYELGLGDLPDDWVVVESGRTPEQLKTEVDALIAAGEYECPSCGNEFGITETTASCTECGFIPEEDRA